MNQNTVENSPSWYTSNEKTTSQHHNSNNYVSHTHTFPSSTTTTHNNHSHTNNNNYDNTAVATTTTATVLPQPPASDDNNDRSGMMAKTDTPHIPNAYSVQQGPESPQQHAAFVLNPNNSNNVQEDVIPANYTSPNPQSFSNNHFAILNNNSSDPTASIQSAAAAVSNNNYSDNNSNNQFSGSLQQRQLLGLTPTQSAAQQPHHLQHRNSQTLSLPMMSYNVASSVIAIRERKQKAAAAEGGDDDVITGAPTAAPPMPLTYKTTYCRSYLRGKVCSFGFGCMFAHNESELRTMAMNIADGLHTFEAMNAYRNGAAVARNNTGGVPPVPGVTTLPQLAAALSRRATEGANAYNASATIQGGTPNNTQLAGYPSSYAYTGSPLLGTNYSTPFVNALPVMATQLTPNTSHQSVHQLMEQQHQGVQPASFQQQHNAMQAAYFNPQLPQPHAVAYGNPVVPSMAGPTTTAQHGHMLNQSTASSSNGSLFKRDANASQGRVGIVTSLPPGYSQSPSATTGNLSNASSQQAIFQYYYGQNQFPSVDAFGGLANNNGTSAPSSNPLHAASTVGTSYTGPQLGVSVTGLGDSSRGHGPLSSFNNVSAANSSLQPLLGTPLGGMMGAQQLPSTSSPPAASVSIPSLGYRRQHSLSAENISLPVGSNSSPIQQSMTTYTTARATESQLGTSLPHQTSFAIVTNAATVSENSTPASASVGPPPASNNTPLRQGAIGANVVSRGAAPPPTYGAQQQQQMLSQPNTAAMAHYYQQTAMQQQQQQHAHQQQQLQLQQQQQQQMLYLYSNSASQGNGVVTMLPAGHQQQHQQQRATVAPHQFYGQHNSVSDANQTSAESQAMLQHLMRAMAIQQPQQGAHAQPQYYYPNQQQ